VGRSRHTSKTREKYERSLFDIFRREADFLRHCPRASGNGYLWPSIMACQRGYSTGHTIPSSLVFRSGGPHPKSMAGSSHFKLSQKPRKPSERYRHSVSLPVKYYPNIVTPLIRAQAGVFVACAELERSLDNILESLANRIVAHSSRPQIASLLRAVPAWRARFLSVC
jgi:hypothetical protein